ncbi:Hypothetical_protein [Hexamita inflata]|uniref:Hypothetical_protein n=1 Tax=Hexamita inflata TaxID=28002 RepID=A0AA86NNX4_9EUKA|nr:Hypothetical protein HINF_LOCUS10537 [Hexamita inflata]
MLLDFYRQKETLCYQRCRNCSASSESRRSQREVYLPQFIDRALNNSKELPCITKHHRWWFRKLYKYQFVLYREVKREVGYRCGLSGLNQLRFSITKFSFVRDLVNYLNILIYFQLKTSHNQTRRIQRFHSESVQIHISFALKTFSVELPRESPLTDFEQQVPNYVQSLKNSLQIHSEQN